jgi:hypothetical protein
MIDKRGIRAGEQESGGDLLGVPQNREGRDGFLFLCTSRDVLLQRNCGHPLFLVRDTEP